MNDIKQTLIDNDIQIKKEIGEELVIDCPVNQCDSDSKQGEYHFYINKVNGTYYCHKCQAKGGTKDLYKLLGIKTKKVATYDPYDYTVYEKKLGQEQLDYLRSKRGLTLDTIQKHHLGVANFYNHKWITIPIFNKDDVYTDVYKLRSVSENNSPKYCVYPKGATLSLYGLNFVDFSLDKLIITEGEFDCMLLHQENLNALSIGAGALTFKDEWLPFLSGFKEIYIWFDNDKAGIEGTESLREKLSYRFPNKRIYKVNFPVEFSGKDITDLKIAGYSLPEVFENSTELESFAIPKDELSIEELQETLSLTIKEDNVNKVLTFLGILSMYTKESQLNIMYNAPSSTGKSYIPIEVSKLFPEEDLIQLAYVSPTAFFHEQGEYIEDKNLRIIDFTNKTIIFLDQPNSLLLERLRPILSHDKEEILIKVTDKNLKGGIKTKNVLLKGFPSVIFCTTNTYANEQELTRVLLLSPETTQDKIKFGIKNRMMIESNKKTYQEIIESNEKRQLLRKRILAIKYSKIKHVFIADIDEVYERFINTEDILKPRHQRDAGKLIQIINTLAVLNQWNRKLINEETIEASLKDIDNAFNLWKEISIAQDLEIPPYVLSFLTEVIYEKVKTFNPNLPITEQFLEKTDLIMLFKDKFKVIISPKELVNKYLEPLVFSGILETGVSRSDGRVKSYILTEFGLDKINNMKG